MDKVVSIQQAIASIRDGDVVAIGGSILRRHPMALVREIVRQGKRDLVLLGWNNALDFDLLVAAGCARRVETSYVGLYMHGIAANFRRAVEQGLVEVHDWTESTAQDRFRAGSMGLTFYPSKVLLGSDITRYNPHIRQITCPFTGEVYVAVPPANPDVAIVHMHYSDAKGNVGLLPARVTDNDTDILIAKSAKRVIVSVEQIVSHEYVRSHPHDTVLPSPFVDMVVEAPFGAHPCSCDRFYDYDLEHLELYKKYSASDGSFREYLSLYVAGTRNEEEYLNRIGLRRLLALRRPNPFLSY